MLAIAKALCVLVSGLLRSRLSLQLEVVALRHQLATYQLRQNRPRPLAENRTFWVLLSRVWSSWRSSLVMVQPASVVPLALAPRAPGLETIPRRPI